MTFSPTFVIGWPEATWIGLSALLLLANLVAHGQPRTGRWNAGSALIAIAAEGYLLWWGGFFG